MIEIRPSPYLEEIWLVSISVTVFSLRLGSLEKKLPLSCVLTKTWLRNLKSHTITTYLLEQLISSFLHIVCENPSTYLINSIKGLFWIIFSSSHLLLI